MDALGAADLGERSEPGNQRHPTRRRNDDIRRTTGNPGEGVSSVLGWCFQSSGKVHRPLSQVQVRNRRPNGRGNHEQRQRRNGGGGLLFMLFMWCGVAAGRRERWHPSKTTRPVDLSGLWFMTIVFAIAPAVVVLAGCCVLCYVGLLRLIRPDAGSAIRSSQVNRPTKKLNGRSGKPNGCGNSKRRRRHCAEWERYHRIRRIEEVDAMTWLQFEEFAITLFRKAGYPNVMGTPINDQGADILLPMAGCKGSHTDKALARQGWERRGTRGIGSDGLVRADFAFVVTTSRLHGLR